MHAQVYLDHQASTPLDPRVLEAMLPFLGPKFGNAASRSHRFGWEAEKAVELARRQVAALAGARPREIVFTSGATESDNLALKGIAAAYREHGNHIVTVSTEHRAVLDPARSLARGGMRLTVLDPEPDGRLNLEKLRAAIRPETVLVSVMYANNEIGVIQPIRQIAALCHEMGTLFHSDSAQAFGKVPIDVDAEGIDLMSVSAHKMYGPKGVGALYVRRPKVRLAPQLEGGGQEFGIRSGTLNVPAIVGFGSAAALAADEMAVEAGHDRALRDRLLSRLHAGLDGVTVNGSLAHRLPGNLNVSFAGVDSESLLMSLTDIACSTGSACSTASVEPSHVLRAIGLGQSQARSSVRFGIGRFNTEDEMDYAANRIVEAVRKLRQLSPQNKAVSEFPAPGVL